MNKVFTVNFGSSSGGLATVGYTLKDSAGNTVGARTTSGVYELGTSTGIYGANVPLADGFAGSIQWDTGGGSPKYANEDINLNQYSSSMAGEVRTLLRAHMNQLVDFLDKRLNFNVDFKPVFKEFTLLKDRLDKKSAEDNESDDAAESKYLEPILQSIQKVSADLREKEQNLLKAIREKKIREYDAEFNASIRKMEELKSSLMGQFHELSKLLKEETGKIAPSVKIPDYSSKFEEFKNSISAVISSIYKSNKEEISGSKEAFAKGMEAVKFLIQELNSLLKDTHTTLMTKVISDMNGSLKSLAETLSESTPDKYEERKKRSEEREKQMRLLQGIYH